jgi:glutamate--cysteine ligase
LHLVDESDAVPIASVEELVSYFTSAGKPRDKWRMGTEHELIGVRATADHGPIGSAPGYDGPDGIAAVLAGFAGRGWTPVLEGDHTIALTRGEDQITIEPGGQFELAARPVADDRDFAAELAEHAVALHEVSKPLGLTWLSTGLRPLGTLHDIPWMPKQRYDVMRAYMPTVGSRGLEMMLRTATVQTNLDFSDEADAAAKLLCLNSVTSIMTALWASSSVIEGKPSAFQSYRAWIWRDTDNARCGLSRFVFDGRRDIFRAYTEWALDVPMYFVYRGGYLPAGGVTFRQFMTDGWRGERATMSDWALHLSTLFPEARLKRFIEVRGCDCGSLSMIAALPAFCRGLLYDDDARAAATALTAGLSWDQRQALADQVPRAGLAARAGDRTLGELARELVGIVSDGLGRVAPTALALIEPVVEIAETGRTQADAAIEKARATSDPAELLRWLEHPGLGAG